MGKLLRRLTFALILCAALPAMAAAQNITGIWRGYFITVDGEQYKLEVQVDQSKSNSLSGVTYSYLTTVFYGKAVANGLVKKSNKSVILQEIRTVEVKMSGSSVACIMKYLLTYVRSGNEEFLEGTYTSTHEQSSFGAKRGDDCGGGTVFLRKVPDSDFYIEPFLRDNPATTKKTTPPVIRPNTTQKTPPVVNKPVNKPTQKQTTQRPVTQNQQKPVVKKPQVKTTTPPVAKTDTVQKRQPVEIERPRPAPPKLDIPVTTRSRTNELTQTVVIRSEEVTVKLYDNGEIDDDTISVYLDGQVVLASKRLSATPLRLTLKMNEDQPEHVLVMVAENLGRIPPNTSLMIVEDGDRRYEVRITSTVQKNAMVRFRYEKSSK